jgi:hypothetical protein
MARNLVDSRLIRGGGGAASILSKRKTSDNVAIVPAAATRLMQLLCNETKSRGTSIAETSGSISEISIISTFLQM